MKILVSTSMPQLIDIDDFKFETLQDRQQYVRDLLKKHPEVIGEYKGLKLYRTGKGGEQGQHFVYDEQNGDLVYVSKYVTNPIRKIKQRAVTQVIVYRNKEPRYLIKSRGIAWWVMKNIYLPKYGYIMSDGQQTDDGRSLWVRLMSDAMHHHVHVYVYNQNQHTMLELKTQEELIEAVERIYTREAKSRADRFVISKVSYDN